MTSLIEDIGALRNRGEPDDKILSAVKQYSPEHADDIDTLLKRGAPPSKVLDAFMSFSGQPAPEPTRSLVSALRHGAASTLAGEAETLRQTTGDGAATAALDRGAQVAKPDDYTPADASMGKGSTWTAWAKALPYRVAESLPGTSQDLAASAAGGSAGALIGGPFAEVTAPAGALIGFGGSYLARTFGSDAKANATARTGRDDATPNDDDKARALAQGVAGAALSRVGLSAAGGSVVKAASSSLIRDLGAQVAKGAAADAATSAASDLTHQALTPGEAPIDTTSAFNAAATGAVTGAGLRVAKGAADVNNASKFEDVDHAVGQRLAARLATEDTSTPSTSFEALGNVRRALWTEVGRFAQDATPQIRDRQRTVGAHDDTALMVAKARADLKAGQPLDTDTLDILGQRLGTHQEGANLVDALAEHSALNQVVQAGTLDNGNKTFGGGATGNPLVTRFLKPFGQTSIAEAGAASAIPALLGHGLHPEFAAGTLAGQTALYGALRGVDKLLGNFNPLDEFSQRFAPDTAPPSIMAGNAGLPSFRQPQGGNGGGGPGPTSGPSGSPPAPISPAQAPAQPQVLQSPPAPSVAPPTPKLSPAPASPQLALARAMMGKAKPGEATPSGPGPGPKAPTSPQAALARAVVQAAKPQDVSSVASPLAAARALQKAQGGDATFTRGQSGPKAKKGASESPRAAQRAKTKDGADYHHDPAGGNVIVEHKGHTVVRSTEGVQRVGDYATATHRNLVIRQHHFDAVSGLAEGAHDREVMTTLHHTLNQRAKSWEDASGYIQEALEEKMTDTHWDQRAVIVNKLLEPRMRATWSR